MKIRYIALTPLIFLSFGCSKVSTPEDAVHAYVSAAQSGGNYAKYHCMLDDSDWIAPRLAGDDFFVGTATPADEEGQYFVPLTIMNGGTEIAHTAYVWEPEKMYEHQRISAARFNSNMQKTQELLKASGVPEEDLTEYEPSPTPKRSDYSRLKFCFALIPR